jgi:hypothetical protein
LPQLGCATALPERATCIVACSTIYSQSQRRGALPQTLNI